MATNYPKSNGERVAAIKTEPRITLEQIKGAGGGVGNFQLGVWERVQVEDGCPQRMAVISQGRHDNVAFTSGT